MIINTQLIYYITLYHIILGLLKARPPVAGSAPPRSKLITSCAKVYDSV